MKPKAQIQDDDLRPEYDFDFSQGERGRYYKKLQQEGSNIVVLEPDLAEAFPDSAAVNDALRSLLEFARLSTGLTRRATGAKRARRVPSK
jgi:arginine deiminase